MRRCRSFGHFPAIEGNGMQGFLAENDEIEACKLEVVNLLADIQAAELEPRFKIDGNEFVASTDDGDAAFSDDRVRLAGSLYLADELGLGGRRAVHEGEAFGPIGDSNPIVPAGDGTRLARRIDLGDERGGHSTKDVENAETGSAFGHERTFLRDADIQGWTACARTRNHTQTHRFSIQRV